jgi:tRNA 5-methylaminomethyl-2-thiouridine biosynthesis bifunctional protein
VGPLTPARLDWRDGHLWSSAYGDVYGSRDGALGQAEQVFLQGCGLPERWRGRSDFTVLETGFGTGLNFLRTWAAWRDDPQRCTRLHYLAAELHPFSADDLRRLHGDHPLAALGLRLADAWPLPVPGFHVLPLAPGLRLTLLFGDALDTLPQLDAGIDAFYLDGFAPDRNPALWDPALIQALAARARPGAVAASYTVAGPVRAALSAAGFEVAKRPGYGRKREALRAVFRGPGRVAPPRPATAAVVGAGVAGAAVAQALAAQGVTVTVFDRAPQVASGASGNPRAAVRPWLNRGDPPTTALTRSAFLHALRTLPNEPQADWQACGLLHLPKDPRDRDRWQAALAEQQPPPALMQWVEAEQARAVCGLRLHEGGLYFPQGGHLDPAGRCAGWLASPGITLRLGRAVEDLSELDGFDQVVLAAAHEVGSLLPDRALPLSRVRGQLSQLPPGSLPGLRCGIARDGYVLPLADGAALVGATYDRHDDPLPDLDGHRANLDRLQQLLANAPRLAPAELAGRAAFRAVLPGRLPAVGRLRGQPRIALATGYASRGVTWAGLLGDTLAAQLCDQPSPLPWDLIRAIRPDRFQTPTS